MAGPPRILYFKQVPAYVLEKHGLKISPMAAYNWARTTSDGFNTMGPKGRTISLNYTQMSMSQEVCTPKKVTTARDVDEFLKRTGMIP